MHAFLLNGHMFSIYSFERTRTYLCSAHLYPRLYYITLSQNESIFYHSRDDNQSWICHDRCKGKSDPSANRSGFMQSIIRSKFNCLEFFLTSNVHNLHTVCMSRVNVCQISFASGQEYSHQFKPTLSVQEKFANEG